MDKPADPATPFGEVYQAFLDDLALEGTKPSTIYRFHYRAVPWTRRPGPSGRPKLAATLRTSWHRRPQTRPAIDTREGFRRGPQANVQLPGESSKEPPFGLPCWTKLRLPPSPPSALMNWNLNVVTASLTSWPSMFANTTPVWAL